MSPLPPPWRMGRPRQALAAAVALGALVAFTALARPQPSPSSRLLIGGDGASASAGPGAVGATLDAEGVAGAAPAAAADAAQRPPADADPDVAIDEPASLLRPLDPVTLADVPSTIVSLGPDERSWPSADGALVAIPDLTAAGRHDVRVLDARTLQPVATLEADGQLVGLHGFTPGAEAVIVEVDGGDRRTLLRHPLDPDQPVTGLSLPAGLQFTEGRVIPLDGGRVAMVVAPPDDAGQVSPPPIRVLVADLVAERLVVDLVLPELAADLLVEGPRGDALESPGFAWDVVGERLFVAHADAARVTVVDLAAGAIVADTEVGTPLPERDDEPVQRWRYAEVSPDGTRLYLTGSEFLPAEGTNRPLGLSVIDTQSLTEVASMSGVAEWLQLSPDGRWLLWQPVDRTLTALMDTREIGTVTLIGGRPGAAYPLGFSPDSSRVYLERHGTDGRRVFVHELPSLRRTAERRLPEDSWFDPATGLLRQDQKGRGGG